MEYRNKISKMLIRCGFVCLLAFALSAEALAAGVQALFNLDVRSEAPFPTNWFSVPDGSNNTNIRVNLPYPDCAVFVSDCEDINVINTLDGFNLQPRLSIPFDGPIDVTTVTSETVFLISLGSTLRDGDREPRVIGINQVVWDPETTTLHVESDELLDQHTRYALIVTRGLRDETGAAVEATEAFRRFRQTVRGEYKQALLEAVHAARRLGVREEDIAVASVFTTQSVTAVLEKIRNQIKAETPEPADFLLGSNGERTVFSLNSVAGIELRQQTRVEGPLDDPVNLSLSLLKFFPGAVGQLAFGKYLSPDYMIHPGEFIPEVGTRTDTPAVQGVKEVYFNLVLPSGPVPAGGWPVAILGHGFTGSKQGPAPFSMASPLASHGMATITINAVGHGFGALGTLSVRQVTGAPVTFPAGGRGIDQNGDGSIGNREGLSAAPPRTIIDTRDGIRQTIADLMQLVRVIQVGMDADGDGARDLDPSRIYFDGISFGSMYGTILVAVEPDVRAGAFAVPGGPFIEWNRLGPANRPDRVGSSLASRRPSLINPPGLTEVGGVAVGPPYFNENMPLRNEPPLINDVAGAKAIQEFFDNTEWVSQSGNPVAYAPHLRKVPLSGVPAKSVIFLFAKGDQSVPNPTNTAIMRAGDLADRATFFRFDLAFAEDPKLPKNPHGFHNLSNTPFLQFASGAQAQIGTFLASDGEEIIHPEPVRFFEVPVLLPLPERLNFIP